MLDAHRHALGARPRGARTNDFAVRECAARPRHIPVHRIPHHVRDDAYAPSSAAECGETNRYFRKSESKIFFARGLDSPNQLEPSGKHGFSAHAIFERIFASVRWRRSKTGLICPTGTLCVDLSFRVRNMPGEMKGQTMTSKYTRRTILRNAASGGAALAVSANAASFAQGQSAPERPNIVFIIADDMGHADISCNGARDFVTPNIDRIAAQGARFTQA